MSNCTICFSFKEFLMARKVTPLYAETLILLKVWALDKTPASKSKFISSRSPAYKTALGHLVETGLLKEEPKNKKTNVYDITDEGQTQLSQSLSNADFVFSAVTGPKTTNALLKWFRQDSQVSHSSHNQNGNGSAPGIESYNSFAQTMLETYDRLNQDYNLDDLVPIYRVRRALGDRLPRQKFNEWLLEVQANDLVQLMGGNLPDATTDQLEDSVAIPGGGTRFYVKRL